MRILRPDDEIRILLVEDHALFRQGLRDLLEDAGMIVVGEAADGMSGVRLAGELRPDVVVMDLHMPRMDGIDATAEIARFDDPPAVLVLTVSTTSHDVLDAIEAGAAGYLLKDAAVGDIVAGIRDARDGHAPVSASALGPLLARIREQGGEPPAAAVLPSLTERETEILRLVAAGRDNTQIAEQLYLSPSTVKNHVSSILEKLGVKTRVQAAVSASRAGIL